MSGIECTNTRLSVEERGEQITQDSQKRKKKVQIMIGMEKHHIGYIICPPSTGGIK